ncbi:MAG: FtsX-like permease family protein [Saprospiraceae bacterium]|nr:FtsX-like permease family protein [Saprospiraceae bacterium]
MQIQEIIKLSLGNIKANLVRAILTLLIIALGITALVGILTSIDGIIFSLNSNFSHLGANTFSINRLDDGMRRHQARSSNKEALPITFQQAMDLKNRLSSVANVAVSLGVKSNATIKYSNKKTNPSVRVRGIDDVYFNTTGYEIEFGRSFSIHEHEYGLAKAIIGKELIKSLFNDKAESALLQTISIDDQKYQVIGILKSKGSTMNEGADRRILIPLINAKIQYGSLESDYDINVHVPSSTQLDGLISQSIGEMRIVRGLKSFEENDFEIQKSDGIITFLRDNTVMLRSATIAIALMTLLGAAIGLMNIMLVSVTERTKEIGINKALGASKRTIVIQFLAEAIIICQMGGITGILLGIPIGNIVTIVMGGEFIIPWAWMLLGFIVCTIVGILSGLYPALKAASLDPVEALRYE